MAKAINHAFPHLRDFEIILWLRFLDKYPDRFQTIQYDVRVGSGTEPPAHFSPELQKMAADLTRPRIDAIGETDGVKTLIEIAPSASTRLLGQLLVYRTLWQQQNPDQPAPKLLLLTDFERPDIRSVADSQDVEILVV